ncbi:hypothetical protein MNV49_002824 [Pseudohyphozyma bogoriensis]|nr:hypothetical protein MNV49_002824 [Pseudohyphozyma bogoriensis]
MSWSAASGTSRQLTSPKRESQAGLLHASPPVSPDPRRLSLRSPTLAQGSTWSDVQSNFIAVHRPSVFRWGARRFGILLILLVVVAFTVLRGHPDGGSGIASKLRTSLAYCPPTNTSAEKPIVKFDKTLAINFVEPQDSYKVQLKYDVRYIVSMSYGGFANQFIGIYHLLYLAKLLRRVAIIPTLMAIHFDAASVPLSQFFDIDRFYTETQIPVLELQDLKWFNETDPPPWERISCWSVHERVTPGGANGNDGSMREHSIEVDYWALPQMRAGSEGWNIWYNELLTFDLDERAREEWFSTLKREFIPQRQLPADDKRKLEDLTDAEKRANMWPHFDPWHRPPPTDQLMCLDTTLFVGGHLMKPPYPATVPSEKLRSYENEGWTEAGQYLFFNDHVEELADKYVLALFGVEKMEQVPPFITVHIRRGDFDTARGLTSLDKYTDGVARVRKKLQSRIDDPDSWEGAGKKNQRYFPGVNAVDYAVVATTDEKMDSPFVKDLFALGWYVLNHDKMRTVEELGEWYPTIIDQCILSRGRGFVGTEWSTYSTTTGLRVKYWNGGVEEWTPSLA